MIADKKKGLLRAAAWIAYSAVILLLVWNHEYWFDEAQAWNIARDNDIAGIIGRIKYEGHPPLWHFVLKFFIVLGASWRALGLISWGISTITAGIILFLLPTKPYFKAALLLSSGMLYCNSVISRVYCLVYLIVALITYLYPRRKEHPFLFGLLVALLANTHICMSALVGILGIYMLVDLFLDWKGNSVRQNMWNLMGLAVAGVGVIVLIIPLWGCLSTNSFAVEYRFPLSGMIKRFIIAFGGIVQSGCAANIPLVIAEISGIAAQFLLIMLFVLLRRKRRTFIMMLTFTLIYMIIVGVVWYTSFCRGALYLFSIAMILVMGEEEKVDCSRRELKVDTRILQVLAGWFEKIDGNTRFSAPVILALVLAISIPSGVKYAIEDLFTEFTPARKIAEFIDQNIPEDALVVSGSDTYSEVLIYLPDRTFFSCKFDRFYTYASHKILPEDMVCDAYAEEILKHDKVYFIAGIEDKVFAPLLYVDPNYMEYEGWNRGIAIYDISAH